MASNFVSVREAARLTGASEGKVRLHIRLGKIRVVRVGYHILIPRRELRKLVADGSKD